MRTWRNWQTRWFQVPVKRFMWVQVPSSAPSLNSLNFFTVGKKFGLFCFIEEFECFSPERKRQVEPFVLYLPTVFTWALRLTLIHRSIVHRRYNPIGVNGVLFLYSVVCYSIFVFAILHSLFVLPPKQDILALSVGELSQVIQADIREYPSRRFFCFFSSTYKITSLSIE